MYYQDNLAFVQEYPSPDGTWELVEKIGEYNRITYMLIDRIWCL